MGYGTTPLASSALAADARALGELKLQAGQNSPAAIKEAARQFESLFMRELIKSMREATMKSGMLDSPGGDLGADLLDQQLAVQMSGRPGGLSDLIAQQLSRQIGSGAAPVTDKAAPVAQGQPVSGTRGATPLGASGSDPGQSDFVRQHQATASAIEQSSGIPASFMLGQAGHETGWGRHEIKMPDGSCAFNLFGIKAGPGWTGKIAEVSTTEYVDGVAHKTTARFRAYDSYQASFQDYARLITQSPRYAQAGLRTDSALAYASGLQKAGYATDPQYAAKLSRAINSTLRLQQLRA